MNLIAEMLLFGFQLFAVGATIGPGTTSGHEFILATGIDPVSGDIIDPNGVRSYLTCIELDGPSALILREGLFDGRREYLLAYRFESFSVCSEVDRKLRSASPTKPLVLILKDDRVHFGKNAKVYNPDL